MSKITGVLDFKDFVDEHDLDYIKKLHIYIGYMDYLYDAPIDLTGFNDKKDFAPYYHYTILTKNLYPTLNEGNVILNERDFFSITEDSLAHRGWHEGRKKINKQRDKFKEYLSDLGYSENYVEAIAEYQPEIVGLEIDEDE